eukprot:264173_1
MNHKYISNQLFENVKDFKENGDDSWSIYHSGKQFLYKYKGEHEINGVSQYDRLTELNINFDNTKAIIVVPKFKDLKEELTINGMIDLCIDQYNNEYKKALIHFASWYRKSRYKNMNVENILCLMVYCNYDGLQSEFSKTYRVDGGKRHNNFYYLGKNIKISVHASKSIGPNCGCCGIHRTYYHGISQTLTFPLYGIEQSDANVLNRRPGIHIHCPLSTSASIEVAISFATVKGLLLEFTDNNSKHLRFSPDPLSVAWLSDFANEKEHLYIQNMFKLQIQNIIEIETNCNYIFILKALKKISGMYNDYDSYDKETHMVTEVMNAIIKDRLSLTSSEYHSFGSLSNYGRKICDVYFGETKQITIQCLQWDNLGFWIEIQTGYKWVNLGLLLALFPNLKTVIIYVKDINLFVFEYIILFINEHKDLKICIKIDRNWCKSGWKKMVERSSSVFQQMNCFIYHTNNIEPISRVRYDHYQIFIEPPNLTKFQFTLFLLDYMDIVIYNDIKGELSMLLRVLIETKICQSNDWTNELINEQQQKFNEHTNNKSMLVINYKKVIKDNLFASFKVFLGETNYCLNTKKK